MKPHLIARDDQKMEVGEEVSGQDGSSACLEEEMINISSLAPDFEIISDRDEPVTLIYARNKYIPPNEIGLLVSPTTTTERSMPLSAMAEDTVSCSMDVS
ncbi:hypothetical protein RDI58_003144 [Solanum bulbocastanum]|uniref:Uncharacterized protein n=1 Tax=Solanum bulbocastanum TaxID=147425 RepID=A0AAN8U7T0_SOLBU